MAKLFAALHASVNFYQPCAGGRLLRQGKYWSTGEPGLPFNHICPGECANPVVLLDEVDKITSPDARDPMHR